MTNKNKCPACGEKLKDGVCPNLESHYFGEPPQDIQSARTLGCNADRSSVEESKICTWTEDTEGNWWTGCDGYWILNDGTPKENDMNFCPICGKALKQIGRKENPKF